MRETLILSLLCLIVALVSLGVVVWAVADAALAGLLAESILTLDGLLMVSIGLLTSLVFGFCFLWTAREARLWEMLRRPSRATAPAGNPSPEESASPHNSQKPATHA